VQSITERVFVETGINYGALEFLHANCKSELDNTSLGLVQNMMKAMKATSSAGRLCVSYYVNRTNNQAIGRLVARGPSM
jgi:hypothetical protein